MRRAAPELAHRDRKQELSLSGREHNQHNQLFDDLVKSVFYSGSHKDHAAAFHFAIFLIY